MEPDFFNLDENLTADELSAVFNTKWDCLFDTVRGRAQKDAIDRLHLSVLEHPSLNETVFTRVFDWYPDRDPRYISHEALFRLAKSPFLTKVLTKDLAEVLVERQPKAHYSLQSRKDLSVKEWETTIRQAKSSMDSGLSFFVQNGKDTLSMAAEQPHLGGLLCEIPWRVLGSDVLDKLVKNPSTPLELLQDIWCGEPLESILDVLGYRRFESKRKAVAEHPNFELPKVYQVGDPLI